jgi:hypothetical protein
VGFIESIACKRFDQREYLQCHLLAQTFCQSAFNEVFLLFLHHAGYFLAHSFAEYIGLS